MKITSLDALDIRFPTSRTQAGSDAMNPDPDYSAAYVVLKTDGSLEGHGLTFTIGRGNQICVHAIRAMEHLVVGERLEDITADFGAYWKHVVSGDRQLRWLGPEKGVMHLAAAAIINAIWDLYAKEQGKPLWKLLADMSAHELVSCVDFTYLHDAITPEEAVEMLARQEGAKEERIDRLRASGYPAYTTSAGWLGYGDERIRSLCREAAADGWTRLKMKVGADLQDDLRRAQIIREEIGEDALLMMDANQAWEVPEAIHNMRALARFNPYWIEEPTSPDDVLGHKAIADSIRPVRVATGEQCQNRVIFKQLITSKAIDVCQIDSCRVAGVNENLSILLMAAKYGIPVCPHAGGVGLCECVQHLSMFDYVAVTGTMEARMIEYVDHLHEHFLDPVVIRNGHYLVPEKPGYSIEMKAQSLHDYAYPGGSVWTEMGIGNHAAES
jgi:L-fuconate dehydratase